MASFFERERSAMQIKHLSILGEEKKER